MNDLLKIAEWIEQHKSDIVQEWIKNSDLIAIFKKIISVQRSFQQILL